MEIVCTLGSLAGIWVHAIDANTNKRLSFSCEDRVVITEGEYREGLLDSEDCFLISYDCAGRVVITEGEKQAELVDSKDCSPCEDCAVNGAIERVGTYSLTINMSGYKQFELDQIVVNEDECHVIPEQVVARMVPDET